MAVIKGGCLITGCVMCLCILLSGGCGHPKERNPLDVFAHKTWLQGDTVALLDDYDIFDPMQVVKKDSVFIIQSSRTDCLLYSLNPYSGEVRKLILRGRGPRELLDIYGLCMTGDKYISAYALNNSRAVSLSFEGDSVLIDFIDTPGHKFTSVVQGDGFFIGSNITADKHFTYYDMSEDRYTDYCDYPAIKDAPDLPPMIQGIFYASGDMALRPAQDKFAFIHFPSGIIRLYSVKEKVIEPYKDIYFYNPDMAIDPGATVPVRTRRTNRYGFFDVVASQDKIYTIYSGKTAEEVGSGIDDCNYLMVFDWEGKPLGCYELAQPVCGIFYEEEENAIYAVSVDAESTLLRFSLN